MSARGRGKHATGLGSGQKSERKTRVFFLFRGEGSRAEGSAALGHREDCPDSRAGEEVDPMKCPRRAVGPSGGVGAEPHALPRRVARGSSVVGGGNRDPTGGCVPGGMESEVVLSLPGLTIHRVPQASKTSRIHGQPSRDHPFRRPTALVPPGANAPGPGPDSVAAHLHGLCRRVRRRFLLVMSPDWAQVR